MKTRRTLHSLRTSNATSFVIHTEIRHKITKQLFRCAPKIGTFPIATDDIVLSQTFPITIATHRPPFDT